MSYLQGNCGMGFAVAAAAPIAAATGPFAPLVLGLGALASALPFLTNIGAGRKEADEIGPEQTKLGNILAQSDHIFATQVLGVSDIQQMDTQLRGIWQAYLQFLYQPAFTADGDTRASDQSKATMEPLVQNRLDGYAAAINKLLGKPNVPTLIQSSGPASLEFRNTSDTNLPQAGFFQPGAVAPTPPQYIGPVQPTVDTGLLVKLAVAGGLVYLISQR